MTKAALEDFWAFVADFRGVTAWVAKAAVAVPLVDIALGIGPPWPTPSGVPVLTCLVEILVLMYSFQFWQGMAKYRLEFRLRTSYIVICIALVAYITLFGFFIYEGPEGRGRDVGGFLYQPNVKLVIDAVKTLDLHAVLENAGYNPIKVWRPWTVYLMRIVVLITWLLFFAALASGIASFVLLQRKGKSLRRRSPAT